MYITLAICFKCIYIYIYKFICIYKKNILYTCNTPRDNYGE